MKVQALIDQLKSMPPDAEVVYESQVGEISVEWVELSSRADPTVLLS